MCGIAGFLDIRTPDASGGAALLERMAARIRHRGPDDYGVYRDGPVELAHRRLSIVDLSPAGHNPMSNENGDVWIVYNGEVFNHASVRPDLERAGHTYRSRSDTETIIHAYEEWGADSVQRFRGMFAFAVWDRSKRRLFCARDRLGIKPFYYYWDGSLFAFASEIKALFEHPAISPRFNDALLAEYLAFGYVSSDETLFRNVRKLMPGHTLTLEAVEGAQPRIERYWEIPEQDLQLESRSEEDWIAECRQRLEETVRMRLMSDVPLGMFLSGGVDSSAIAALMTRMVDGRVKTFSVGYQEDEYSELGYARQVAERIGTEHREVVVGMEEFFNALPKLIWHEDEPIAWPSSISLYFVSKLAREHVTVVLTGEGSDEMFAGYARYARYLWNNNGLKWYGMLPGFVRAGVRDVIAESRIPAAAFRRKLQHTFVGRAPGVESLHVDNFYSAFGEEEQRGLLRNPEATGAAYRSFLRYWNAERNGSLLARMLYADQKTYLVELLMKQDQMSMANSLESRVPFLDHTFVEFAWRVPDALKLKNGTAKYILKRAVEDLLPHDIIYRTKMGFPTPIRDWLLRDTGRPLLDRLKSPKGLLAEYVNPEAIDRLIESQVSGREDATDRIWRLLNLQVWGDLFFTGERDRVIHDPLVGAAVQA
jgi:asparagine synthase (glutamine-hydrolysing)